MVFDCVVVGLPVRDHVGNLPVVDSDELHPFYHEYVVEGPLGLVGKDLCRSENPVGPLEGGVARVESAFRSSHHILLLLHCKVPPS